MKAKGILGILFGWAGGVFLWSTGRGIYPMVEEVSGWPLKLLLSALMAGLFLLGAAGGFVLPGVLCIVSSGWRTVAVCVYLIATMFLVLWIGSLFGAGVLPVAGTALSVLFAAVAGIALVALGMIFIEIR